MGGGERETGGASGKQGVMILSVPACACVHVVDSDG